MKRKKQVLKDDTFSGKFKSSSSSLLNSSLAPLYQINLETNFDSVAEEANTQHTNSWAHYTVSYATSDSARSMIVFFTKFDEFTSYVVICRLRYTLA